MREVVDPAPGKLTWHLKNGGPLGQGGSYWKSSFLGSMLLFVGVYIYVYILFGDF